MLNLRVEELRGLASDASKKEECSRTQYAALPYRLTAEHGIEILIITSRGTGRWVIPKGWPMKDRAPAKTAAREAYEEAGLEGRIHHRAFGTFRYQKFLDAEGVSVLCEVRVFPLLVERELKKWPEDGERLLRWVDPEQAAELVNEPDLGKLILDFAEDRRIKAH